MNDTSPPNLQSWSGPSAPECCSVNKSQVRQCSERLQEALEIALERNLNGLGSTIYKIVWKPHVTPSGRQISRLRASARRTSANEPSSAPLILKGWTTPSSRDWKDTPGMSTESVNRDGSKRNRLDQLPRQAGLAGWPTPVSQPDGKSPEAHLAMKTRMGVRDGSGANRTSITDIQVMAKMAGWPTPQARDHFPAHTPEYIAEKKAQGHGMSNLNDLAQATGPMRLTVSGEMLIGSSAEMESGGQLNPAFSAWLQGYPEVWCNAALSCQLPTRSRKNKGGGS